MRPIRVLLLLLLATAAVRSQEDLLRLLLELPPPDPPGVRAEPSAEDRFLGEWAYPGRTPDPATRERLWELARTRPWALQALPGKLPDRPEVHAAILEVYRALPEGGDRDSLGAWLRRNTPYLRDELLRGARAFGHGEEGEEDLEALAALDPQAARPLLQALLRGGRPYPSTVARSLLWRSDPGDEASRNALLRVARDRGASAASRDAAVTALLEVDWPGRDRLFLRLMEDPTLRDLSEDSLLYRPLAWVVFGNPDHWIPRVVPLVGHPNRAVHDNAVEALIAFQLEHAREDALRPLLPWLLDERWSSASDRLRLIQSLEDLRMPEAVPGLIAVVRSDAEPYERSYAAQSLSVYGDARAVPALREALAREEESGHRGRYLAALLALGALPLEEQVRGLEAFARAGGRDLLFDVDMDFRPRPLEVVLGAFLAGRREAPPGLVPRVVERLEQVPALEDFLLGWSGPEVDAWLLHRLLEGPRSVPLVLEALERRERLRETGGPRLRAASAGIPAGLAAAVLEDPALAETLLAGEDVEARTALLAASRLTAGDLPVATVARLLPDPAARAWLAARDTPETRAALEADPEFLILGGNGGELARITPPWEEQLAGEVRTPGGPSEIFALFTTGYYEAYGHFVVRVQDARGDLSWYGDALRVRHRPLDPEELRRLRDFVRTEKVDEWPKLNDLHGHSAEYLFLHLTPRGGRRVYSYHPGAMGEEGAPYARLNELIRSLATHGMQLHYRVFDAVPGSRVVLEGGEHGQAVELVGQGDEVYVQLASSRLPPELLQGEALRRFGLGPDKPVAWLRLGPEGWHEVPRPPFVQQDAAEDVKAVEGYQEHLNNPACLVQTPEGSRLRVFPEGLHLTRPGKPPQRLARGEYADPLVSADGRWGLAARSVAGGWLEPNVLEVVDLGKATLRPAEIPAAGELRGIAWIPSRQRFLVLRQEEGEHGDPAGPATHFLLDPVTAKAEVVPGEFAPWHDAAVRPLQASSRAGRAWAARTTEGPTLEIGLYDPHEFVFDAVARYPHLAASSDDIWVVEARDEVYVRVGEDVLALPLDPSRSGAPSGKSATRP